MGRQTISEAVLEAGTGRPAGRARARADY